MAAAPKRLNVFERYLTVWVGLCMVGRPLLGKSFQDSVNQFEAWSLAREAR